MSGQRQGPSVQSQFPQFSAGMGDLYHSILNVASYVGAVTQAFGIAYEPQGELHRQARWKLHPNKILEPLDAAIAFQRGLTSDASLTEYVARNGYGAEYKALFKGLAEQLMTFEYALELNRRGDLNDADTTAVIGKLGYSQADAERLQGLKTRLPQTQDVLQWLVREVLDPTERTRLQLDTDFPVEALPYFAQLGYDDEYARNTWAAHWVLPGITQAYTMFHRRLISDIDLGAILKAQDIAPIYRQPLIDAAYSPLTRVDVRRMHNLGVLTKAQVKTAYLDLGYNEVNATRLADFVEAYNNRGDENPNSVVASDVTIGDLTRAYQERVITEAVFRQSLTDIGVSPNRVNLVVEAQDNIKEARDTRLLGDTLRLQIRNGVITVAAAIQAINTETTDTELRDYWAARLNSVEGTGEVALSKTDLLRAYKLTVLNGDELMQRLIALGFTADDAGILLQTHGPAESELGGKVPPKKDLDKLRAEDIITADDWRGGLVTLGFGPIWVERYNRLWELQNVSEE